MVIVELKKIRQCCRVITPESRCLRKKQIDGKKEDFLDTQKKAAVANNDETNRFEKMNQLNITGADYGIAVECRRVRCRLSQDELAEMLAIDTTLLRDVELGKAPITEALRIRIKHTIAKQ